MSADLADSIRAAQVCAGVKPGEIVIFDDRAYVDFVHLGVLHDEGVFWPILNTTKLQVAGQEKLTKVPKRFGTTFRLPQLPRQAFHETGAPVRRPESTNFRHHFNLPSPEGELFF